MEDIIIKSKFNLDSYEEMDEVEFKVHSYHSSKSEEQFLVDGKYSQTESKAVKDALERIYKRYEPNMVVLSFGLELAVWSATPLQRKVIYNWITDIKNKCGVDFVIQRDSALDESGFEIILMPVDGFEAIEIVQMYQYLINKYDINMNNTGMHITVGTNCSLIQYEDNLAEHEGYRLKDLQIRLNKLWLVTRSCLTESDLKKLFGRVPNKYCQCITESLSKFSHYLALSCDGRRNGSTFEFRVPTDKCDIKFVIKYLTKISYVFRRPVVDKDLISLIKFLSQHK